MKKLKFFIPDLSEFNQDKASSYHWEAHDILSISSSNLNFSFLEKSPNDQETFNTWKIDADLGLAQAQYYVAKMYENGKGIQQSYQIAARYYHLAVEQGHCEALFSLACLYQNGLGVQQDIYKAFYYYQLAANNGNITALACLGKCYQYGLGIDQSLSKAIDYYQLAANLGSVSAWGHLANMYKNGEGVDKSEEKAEFYFQKRFHYHKNKADKGDSHSQAITGKLFEKGHGTEQSIESAIYYYQLAADQNNTIGLSHLAECYAKGKGVEQSSDKAIFYYKRAAKLNDTLSQFVLANYLVRNNIDTEQGVGYFKLILQTKRADTELIALCEYELGHCFEMGIGIKQSHSNAIYYYNLASQHGNKFAQMRLGEIHLNGELGIQKAPKKAVPFFSLAADQEHYFAYPILAQCYEKGIGVNVSQEKSLFYKHKLFEYYQREVEKGDPYFQIALGQLFETGNGTPKSPQQAIYYYQLAAEQNDPQGLFVLAQCFAEGRGTNQSYDKAALYYQRAANFGHIDAQRELNTINESIAELKRKEHRLRARQFSSSLTASDITYPQSIKLDLSLYLENRDLTLLKKLFEESKNDPIYLSASKVSFDEMVIIRDAMLENPRFTFICPRPDYYSLYEAFHRVGYKDNCLKKVIAYKENGKDWYGHLFIG